MPNHGESFATIFKIGKKKLMTEICKDLVSFKHMHEISLERLRYNQKMEREMMKLKKQFGKKRDQILLFDVLEIMSKMFGETNDDILDFYNSIKI